MKRDYTSTELARLVGVHPDTVRRLARARLLSGAYKVGRQWRFARELVGEMRRQVRYHTYYPAAIDMANGPLFIEEEM